jgi:hypothetical protein
MRMKLPGLLIVAALSYLAPWQDPDGERRPGPRDRGDQDPGRPPRPEDDPDGPPPPPFGPPPNPMFEAIDADDDGELSPKEIAKAAKSLMKLDKNKDGILTEDEVRPPRPRRGPGGPPGGGGPEGAGKAAKKGDRRPGPPGEGPPGPPPREADDDEDHGRPVEAIAKELGVTPEKFREVFKKVRPAGPGQQPTEAQRRRNRKILSEGLGVSPEKLDEVMDKYRPGGRGDNGPPR